jgi:hypothetical protein
VRVRVRVRMRVRVRANPNPNPNLGSAAAAAARHTRKGGCSPPDAHMAGAWASAWQVHGKCKATAYIDI